MLSARGEVPLTDMLHAESHLFPRGTTLIVVTPTTRDNWATAVRQLSRRGLRVVTVLVDPGSFGSSRSGIGLATLLEASGMAVYLVRNGDDITAVLSQSKTQAGYFTVA